MFANKNGRGDRYWRVQLGKRFTDGKRITRDFDSLQEAKRWVFGDAQSKAEPGSLLELKARAGAAAFELTPARIAEPCNAFDKECWFEHRSTLRPLSWPWHLDR